MYQLISDCLEVTRHALRKCAAKIVLIWFGSVLLFIVSGMCAYLYHPLAWSAKFMRQEKHRHDRIPT